MLFAISVGTNDLVDNFYELPTRKLQFSISGYQDFLLHELESAIQANKCFNVCVEQQNTDSIAYNKKLRTLTSWLEGSWPNGAKVAYLDIYDPMKDMVNNPAKYGFEQTLEGCCGVGIVEMGPLCNEMEATCPDPSKYMFWDAVHPSQATYWILAQMAMQTVIPHLLLP
ncbi:hypothetical protein GH714_037313 [Hevea brasiliensis]|uniref:SGNH hydrolase-type esterase domain-containing protein n=1 Tax=Hevea brasiliensis TaxID=3981 RepID=A0A6A6L9J2_HEVBR|nr:hypothetical protein GH714_037313 [Hevea brasiliensis]